MTDTMPRKLPPFVTNEPSRHGKPRLYFRRGKGPRIRLPLDIGSEAFQEAYEAALTGKAGYVARMARTPSNSLQWLIERYMESGKWAGYSQATRKKNGLIFKDAIQKSGNPAFLGITRRTIQRSVDQRAKTPAQANNFLKAMRGLFKWAVLAEYVETDPTAGVPSISYKTDGFKLWQPEDVERFCQRWPVGTKPRLAFELYLVSGLRRSDVHKVGPQHVKGDTLTIRAMKPPYHMISITLPQFLLKTINATPTGDMAFMVKDNGMPFTSKESFGNWFGARCREAGLEKGKAAHGIRKRSATIAAEAGDTTHDLMAHYGWSNPQQAEIYTRGADRQRLGKRSSERAAEHYEAIIPRTLDQGAGESGKNEEKSNTKKAGGGR